MPLRHLLCARGYNPAALPLVLPHRAGLPLGDCLSEKYSGGSRLWPYGLLSTTSSSHLGTPLLEKLEKQVNTGHLDTTYLVKHFPATASPRVKGWGHTVGRHDCLPPPRATRGTRRGAYGARPGTW